MVMSAVHGVQIKRGYRLYFSINPTAFEEKKIVKVAKQNPNNFGPALLLKHSK